MAGKAFLSFRVALALSLVGLTCLPGGSAHRIQWMNAMSDTAPTSTRLIAQIASVLNQPRDR